MSNPYPEVKAIALACDHTIDANYYGSAPIGDGKYRKVCNTCCNAAKMAHKAARKAELANRPKDCYRCGLKPHTFLVAGWKLCGTCKKLTMMEHNKSASKAGVLALFATAPMVDTTTWAARKK
jgi:hypothetical protein